MARHVVTGPLALVRDPAGKIRYCYAGAIIPEDTPAEQVKRLTARGLIAELTDTAPAPDTAASELGEDASAAPDSDDELERPPQVAAKGAWVDYAVARGMDRATAEAMTKQELITALSG